MPKHIVTAIGLIVSLGVIALGVFLVALPIYFQAVDVDGQTATVASTNAIYQAQVDNLTEQQGNLEQINADVAGLRAQIPANAQLDDVFEVVGQAAEAAGVSLTAVTAGEQAVYVARTGATDADAAAPTPAPASTPAPTSDETSAATGDTTGADAASNDGGVTGNGREQVDFVITATAGDMAQATAFIDALRAGPRLLNSISATTTQTGEGTVDIQITALTYLDSEG